MHYRNLGKTGLSVSALGFGGWAIGGHHYSGYGPADEVTSLAALNTAYDLGCTLFDTADVYGFGLSEERIGKALQGWERERIVIATKAGLDFTDQNQVRPVFSEMHLRRACEASLKRLNIERIDLYQLQTPSLELIQLGRIFETLAALKQEGKIRLAGISVLDPQEGIQAIAVSREKTREKAKDQIDSVQMVYNLFDRRAEGLLFESCAQTGTALLIREPLARGFLSGRFDADRIFGENDHRAVWPKPLLQKRVQAAERYAQQLPEGYAHLSQLALQFALKPACVSSVLVGCRTPEQVRENFSALDVPELTQQDWDKLTALQHAIF